MNRRITKALILFHPTLRKRKYQKYLFSFAEFLNERHESGGKPKREY